MNRSDQQLLSDFESCSISQDDWNHRAHVRVAFLYAINNSYDAALSKMRSRIMKLNAAHDTPEAIDRGYHETMTAAFMRLIMGTIRTSPSVQTSNDFCETHAELMNKRVLLNFYSREHIMTWEAKSDFISPDIAPLPYFGNENITILQAFSPNHIIEAKSLFEEYAHTLTSTLCHDLEYQNFNNELENLPGEYAPPEGRLLLAFSKNQTSGCVAIRPQEKGICELKRLWVKPEFRSLKIGRTLTEQILKEAKKIGYHSIWLDTLSSMTAAFTLYKSLGFKEIESYRFNPFDDAVFLERKL